MAVQREGRFAIDIPRRWGKHHAYEQQVALLRALGYRVEEIGGAS